MHHIVLRIGDDDFTPALVEGDVSCVFHVEAPGQPNLIRNSIKDDLTTAGLSLPPASEDVLHLAMAVYSADLYVRRATGFDSWTRNLRLHLPVLEHDRWSHHVELVTEMLSFLTGDHWSVAFRHRELPKKLEQESPERATEFTPSAVSLFSGGLDSFIGAIECLGNGGTLSLVGHYGAGTTNQAQENAYRAISSNYKDKTRSFRFYVQPPMPSKGQPEKTTRSRSILFLALGTAVATGYGQPRTLYVPENGLISLNPPLTDSRMGTYSTRTTHPHFMDLYRRLLSALDTGVSVETLYRFRTKGEMARAVVHNQAFLDGLHSTVSCSHPDVGRYQKASPGQHCGYCVPCIIRRAALLAVGLDDASRYLSDIRTNRPPHDSDTNRDLRAFEMALASFDPDSRSRHLFDVLSTGPIPPEHIEQFVDVYRRGMLEVRAFLNP